jgi:acyl carrier protein
MRAMQRNRAKILGRIIPLINSLKGTNNSHELDEEMGLLGRGIGVDSIEVLQLVTAIEKEFDLTIDDDELAAEQFRSVGNLITFIEGKL